MTTLLIILLAIAGPYHDPTGQLQILSHFWLRPRPVARMITDGNERLVYSARPTTLRTFAEFALFYRGGINLPPPSAPPMSEFEQRAKLAEILFMR